MLEIWNGLITAKEDYRARAIPRDRGDNLRQKNVRRHNNTQRVCIHKQNFIAHEGKMDEM